jgi:nicotinate-nucleotide adenylyltransferase
MTQTRRLSIFGGTFDPPHVGHVLAAHYVLMTSRTERIFVVPCAEHPFGKEQAAFEHRLAMCRLACQSLGEAVEVLDIEGRRRGPSYTIDTIRELRRQHPEARLELIVGSDIPPEFPKWKDAEALHSLVDLRVLPRQDASPPAGGDDETLYHLPRISSSDIRDMLAHGRDVAPHVPHAVLDYIRVHGLYGLEPAFREIP